MTFNGSCFDVPVLNDKFPEARTCIPQIDLRFACAKIGMRGGLKHIERQIGIERDDGIADVDGMEAVRLWHAWGRGDRDARDRLVEYNRADTENLEALADYAYPRLVAEYAGFDPSRVRRPPSRSLHTYIHQPYLCTILYTNER